MIMSYRCRSVEIRRSRRLDMVAGWNAKAYHQLECKDLSAWCRSVT